MRRSGNFHFLWRFSFDSKTVRKLHQIFGGFQGTMAAALSPSYFPLGVVVVRVGCRNPPCRIFLSQESFFEHHCSSPWWICFLYFVGSHAPKRAPHKPKGSTFFGQSRDINKRVQSTPVGGGGKGAGAQTHTTSKLWVWVFYSSFLFLIIVAKQWRHISADQKNLMG